MSGQQPQPPLRMTDPFTSHCREWITGTPYVTQFLMALLVASYILSWIIPVESLIENTPLSTVFCFEMYRLVVSPLVAGNLVNLILVASSFRSMGTRIESSLGSASYVCIIVIVTLTTNIVFATSCILLHYAAVPAALSYGSSGFWVVLFGLTSMECTQEPNHPKRLTMIPIDIPGKYYPAVMYGLFCLFEGPKISYVMAIMVGYLHQTGQINFVRPSSALLEDLESSTGIMYPLSRRKGWVKALAATGFEESMMADNSPTTKEDLDGSLRV